VAERRLEMPSRVSMVETAAPKASSSQVTTQHLRRLSFPSSVHVAPSHHLHVIRNGLEGVGDRPNPSLHTTISCFFKPLKDRPPNPFPLPSHILPAIPRRQLLQFPFISDFISILISFNSPSDYYYPSRYDVPSPQFMSLILLLYRTTL
jgi:hypothetical protein